MSMNFGREQALLRQRLTNAGTTERAAELEARLGEGLRFLGAPPDEVQAAADDLTAAFPEMGRAQMTAFVRTLWRSKIHELRLVGVEILAQRSALLEPPDMPFVHELLEQARFDELTDRLARGVLGPLVGKNKKLWKELQKLARSRHARLRRAAIWGAEEPLRHDASVFDRFEKLAKPLLDDAGADLLQAVDAVLAAATEDAAEAVRQFAALHGRKVRVPKAKAAAKEAPAAAAKAGGPGDAKRAPAKKAAAKKTAAKKAPAKKAPAKRAPAKKKAAARVGGARRKG